jgi:hypothetical protein
LGIEALGLSSLSYALSNRSSKAFREYFYRLLGKVKRDRIKIDRKFTKFISIVDSTSMPFSGSGSEWAQGWKSRREAKAHVQLDYDGMPLDMVASGASVHDIRGFKELNLGSTEVLIMDRAYYGYKFWKMLNERDVTFVTRAKKNMKFKVLSNKRGRKPRNVIEDQRIEFAKPNGKNLKFLYSGESRSWQMKVI